MWHTVRDGFVDPATDSGEFMSGVRLLMDRQEVRRKSVRQRATNRRQLAEGVPLIGKRRFGYAADHMTPHPVEAEHVRWASAEALTGSTLYAVAKTWHDSGVTGAYGHRWTPATVRKLLLNVRNKGVLIHGGVEQPVSQITPLVSTETWENVQAILHDPTRKVTPGPQVRSGMLSGIAFCGVCGSALQTTANTQRGKTIPLYRCAARVNGYVQGKHPAIRRNLLDDAAMANVFEYFADVEEAGDRTGDGGKLAPMLTQLTEINRQRTVAGQLALMPGADLKDVGATLARLGKEADALEERMTRERASSVRSSVVDEVRRDWWEDVDSPEFGTRREERRAAWPDYWRALDVDRRREVIQATLIIRLNPVGEDRIDITWIDPLSPE